MTSGIDESIAETDDCRLCDRIYDWIVERHGEQLDLSNVPEHERVVLCVRNASGIIDNGGFNHLFETSFEGDPHYLLTADAFKAIGAQECFAAFEQVFRLFRDRKPPPDPNARLKQYRQGGAAPRHEIDQLFWKGSQRIDLLLAAYVRAHRQAYVNAAPARKMKKSAAYPADGNLAIIASKAARTALMAAEAVLNGPDKSANYAAEAVSDAIDLADAVEKNTIPRRIAQELADLERESARHEWDDQSPISPTVFTNPSKPGRPWWKFW